MTKEDMEIVAQVVVQTMKDMGIQKQDPPKAEEQNQQEDKYAQLEKRLSLLEGKNELENRLENGFGNDRGTDGQVFEGNKAYEKMIDALTGQLDTAQELNRKFFSVLQNPAQTQPKSAEEILAGAVR